MDERSFTMRTNEERLNELLAHLDSLDHIHVDEIPQIDLYMDQVTTFMEKHLGELKRYPEDKVLTKTMINNYAKNNLLPSPVRKKYTQEHILLLVFIYYFKNLLNTFTGIILLTGIAYLCYPQKKTNQENELVLNEYKLVYETESTASQYFISDTEAWNTLRKQLKTTAQGHAILYISESCELPIINNTILAKKRNFDCWKPVCAGQISKDFGEI